MITLAAPPPTPAPVTPAPSEAKTIASLKETVSPLRLTLFLQCRLKFWFRYVAHLAKPKSAALHVGSSVHAVLNAWNKARWRQTPLT